METEETTVLAPTNGAHPATLMGRLRAQRQTIADRTSVEIRIRGYDDPQLVPRYRLLLPPELEVIGQNVRRAHKGDSARLLAASINILVAACEGFFIREIGSDDLVPLDPGDGNPDPVKFDLRLAEALGIPLPDEPVARDIVRGVFGGEKHDVELVEYGQMLQRWMADTSIDVNRELLGE